MATGRCVNIMHGCSLAKARKIQEADKANFVCEECGKPLVECEGSPQPKGDDTNKVQTGNGTKKTISQPKGKIIALIAAAVVVLGGGGFGIFKALQGGNQKPVPHSTKIATVTTDANWTVETSMLSLNPNDTIWIKANDNISKGDQEKGVKPQITLEDSTSTFIISPESVTDKANVVVNTVDGKSDTYFIALHKNDSKEKPEPPVFGGRATYDRAAGVITFNSTVTISLHDENDNTLTFRRGDKIRLAKVSGGCLISGEAVINGESQLLSGINEKL